MTIRKILQIIPATGWYAIYKDGDDNYHVPLPCWALWEDARGDRHVSGLNAGASVDVCESIADFVGYTRDEQPPPRAQEAGR